MGGVEWLEKVYQRQKSQPFDDDEWNIAFEHAKEMDKERIMDAWDNGKKTGASKCKGPVCQMKTALGYYNKLNKSE
jgi:hypothetical protein